MPIDGTANGNEFATALAGELPRLVHLATRLVRDPDQAEDCAQETIVGAWRRRDQLRDPASLGAWLRRSLVSRIIDRSRVHHDELDIDDVEADWQDDRYSVAPDRVLERAELRDELEDALARLPVIYRVTVVSTTCWDGRESRSRGRCRRGFRRPSSDCGEGGCCS